MLKKFAFILCCLSSAMHYAMEPEALAEISDTKERENLRDHQLRQYDPNKYIFEVFCENNKSPYSLSLLFNNLKGHTVEPGGQKHVVAIDVSNDDDTPFLAVYKNGQVIVTKYLKEFLLPYHKEHRFYDGVCYGNFFSGKEEYIYDYDNMRTIRRQLQKDNNHDDNHRAKASFYLNQNNNVISLEASIEDHLDYDYKKISFFALRLRPHIQYMDNCLIPLDPRKKTFMERHWFYRTEDEDNGFSVGSTALVSAPLGAFAAICATPAVMAYAMKKPTEFLRHVRNIKQRSWPFFLGFLQGAPLSFGMVVLLGLSQKLESSNKKV